MVGTICVVIVDTVSIIVICQIVVGAGIIVVIIVVVAAVYELLISIFSTNVLAKAPTTVRCMI